MAGVENQYRFYTIVGPCASFEKLWFYANLCISRGNNCAHVGTSMDSIENAKVPIPVFWKTLIPDSGFWKYETDRHDFPTRVFSNICKVSLSQILIFPNNIINKKERCWDFLVVDYILNVVGSKLNTIGFGGHGHVKKSEKHEDDFSDFPKVKSKG